MMGKKKLKLFNSIDKSIGKVDMVLTANNLLNLIVTSRLKNKCSSSLFKNNVTIKQPVSSDDTLDKSSTNDNPADVYELMPVSEKIKDLEGEIKFLNNLISKKTEHINTLTKELESCRESNEEIIEENKYKTYKLEEKQEELEIEIDELTKSIATRNAVIVLLVVLIILLFIPCMLSFIWG